MDHRRNKTENQKSLGDKWKHNHPNPRGCSKSSSNKKFYRDIVLPQEGRKITNSLRQPDIILKVNRERRKKTQS